MFGSSEVFVIVVDGVESKIVVFSCSAEVDFDDGKFVVLTKTDPRLIVNNRSCYSNMFLPILL